MRTALQAILADRPRLVAVGVALRWLAWLAVGHPIWLITTVFGWARGFSLLGGLALATIVEIVLTAWAAQGLTPGADTFYMWQQASRFRRRFPATFAKAYRDPRLLALAVGNIYSAPGGLRPVLSAPQLSLLPTGFAPKTVGWVLTAREQHEPSELVAAMNRIAQADSRLAWLRVQPTRQGGLALIASFAPPTAGRSGLVNAQLNGMLGGRLDGGQPDSPHGSMPWTDPDQPFNSFYHLGDPADPWDAYADAQGDNIVGPLITGAPILRPRPPSTKSPSTYIQRITQQSPIDEETQPMIIDTNNPPIHTQPSTTPLTSLIDGPPIDGGGFIDRTATFPRTRTPMGWSLFVLAPANLLAGLAVMAADVGFVGTTVLFAMALISLLLVAAEATWAATRSTLVEQSDRNRGEAGGGSGRRRFPVTVDRSSRPVATSLTQKMLFLY